MPPHVINNIEPLFSRVWIDDATVSQIVNSNVSKEHELANKLLNFTDEQWEKTSKYHNLDLYYILYLIILQFHL